MSRVWLQDDPARFSDDSRVFGSIPARRDVWRRASANWLDGLLVRSLIDLGEDRSKWS
jgi:hypothetical protein